MYICSTEHMIKITEGIRKHTHTVATECTMPYSQQSTVSP